MQLPKEIIEYAQKATAKTAQLIADKMTETAKYAINKFYDDYTPMYYNRHYFNFKNNSFRRYYKNQHSKTFIGGVELTPERMQDVYQDPVREVFDSVYAGFHGVSSMFENPKSFTVTPRMKPSPMEILKKKQENIKKNLDDYINKAQKSF